ncbi:MAG: hypothetical protein JNM84_15860 [Planctomycetes bacterium]|nr:hypothetical protein [Planctomycetota bacterium]
MPAEIERVHLLPDGFLLQTTPRTVAAKLANDESKGRLDVEAIVAAHVHAFDLRGIESKEGEELLRTRAYDTFIHSPK